VNLLHNATKFTPEGGNIWLSLAVERAKDNDDPVAVIRVRDNGAGIDAAALPRIFDLFVQGDRGTGRSRSGLGIGLTLAKRLIERHGGPFEVFSGVFNRGGEFVVRLPLKSPPPPAAQPAARKGDGGARPAVGNNSSRRVLIVDDDADGAEGLRLL